MKEHPVSTGKPLDHRFHADSFFLPHFKWFYLPNYLRGLGMGVMNSISVICIKEITDDASFVSGLVTLLAATGQYVCASILMAVFYRFQS